MQKLNKIERLKARLAPADFAQRLERLDWNAPDEEIRFYLKNFGIYNIKLRPDQWMLRLRIDGGRPSLELLDLAARSAQELGLKILLTARGQIELHGISAEEIYPLWRRFNAIGCGSLQTLTDNVRAILTDPLDAFAPDSKIDCTPLIEKMTQNFCRNPRWIGTLPRKFNTALIGRTMPSFNPWGNDLLFALAQKEDLWGFNLYLGGKNSQIAADAEIFCLPQEAPALFLAVIQAYSKFGLRSSRSKTRLFHLIETIGISRMRCLIEESYGRRLQHAGVLKMRSSSHNQDHLLPIRRLGHHGEIEAETLENALFEATNSELRLTPYQELWIFDPSKLASRRMNSSRAGNVTACAGSRYCSLSLWDIKKDLNLLPQKRVEEAGMSLGFSGCLKGCGRHQHSDLGLIGLRTNLYGSTERAARVYLGALQAPDPAPARLLYYAVPLRRLSDLIHVLLEDFEQSDLPSFEAFTRKILSHYEIEFLQFWYLSRQLRDLSHEIRELFVRGEREKLLEAFPPFSPSISYETIRTLSHRLWDL